jgi:hypothetical protein
MDNQTENYWCEEKKPRLPEADADDHAACRQCDGDGDEMEANVRKICNFFKSMRFFLTFNHDFYYFHYHTFCQLLIFICLKCF